MTALSLKRTLVLASCYFLLSALSRHDHCCHFGDIS